MLYDIALVWRGVGCASRLASDESSYTIGTGVDETTPRGEGTSSLLAAAWEGGTVLLSRTRVKVNAVTAQPVI